MNFIFVHVYKTAGTSITEILQPYADIPPRIAHNLRKCDKFGLSELHIGRFHFFCNHATAGDIRARLGVRNFDAMFSFGFVRNPWERIVSLYHYEHAVTQRHNPRHLALSFEERVEQLACSIPRIPPQTRFLFSEQGKQLVSFIGRFETLGADLAYIGARIGISFDALRHLNATRHADYRDYYNPRTKELVGALFAADIAHFGYAF